METELYIDEDGKITCVYQDEISTSLKDLGSLRNKRACYVEPYPCDTAKWMVRVNSILQIYPPKSGNYQPRWFTIVGVFDTREEALRIEAEWLSRYLTTRHFCKYNQETKQFE